jgi:hypothetical protein
MPAKFAVGDRVRCLATRFDDGSEDRNGDVFSVRQRALGHGKFYFGAVKWVYSTSGRRQQIYRVLWDGDFTPMQSSEAHLEPVGEEPLYDRNRGDDNFCGNITEPVGNSVTIIFVTRALINV